jgi:DNA polymerase III sliding clamp (beta) subunit (PCNA family)
MESGSILTVAGLISFVVSSGVSWFLHRDAINHVHNVLQAVQSSQHEVENRRKAAIVAELLALWIQSGEGNYSSKKLTADEYKRLTELSFECSFWLPQDILTNINKLLVNAQGAKNAKDILIDVRNYLKGENEKIDPMTIVHF